MQCSLTQFPPEIREFDLAPVVDTASEETTESCRLVLMAWHVIWRWKQDEKKHISFGMLQLSLMDFWRFLSNRLKRISATNFFINLLITKAFYCQQYFIMLKSGHINFRLIINYRDHDTINMHLKMFAL